MSQAETLVNLKAHSSSESLPAHRQIPLQRIWVIASILVSLTIYLWTTPYMGIASFAYFLMIGGLVVRKQRLSHMKFMGTAMLIDFALVLVLEFQRSAIGTAVDMSLNMFQQGHILTSTLALILYLPIVILGLKSFRQRNEGLATRRKWHVMLGITAFIFRTAGFVLMFSLIEHVRTIG